MKQNNSRQLSKRISVWYISNPFILQSIDCDFNNDSISGTMLTTNFFDIK